jgi:hypothetical protein
VLYILSGQAETHSLTPATHDRLTKEGAEAVEQLQVRAEMNSSVDVDGLNADGTGKTTTSEMGRSVTHDPLTQGSERSSAKEADGQRPCPFAMVDDARWRGRGQCSARVVCQV